MKNGIKLTVMGNVFHLKIKDDIKEGRQKRRRRTGKHVLRGFAKAGTDRALI